MSDYFKSVALFFKRFFIVLCIYQICRFLFYFFNKNSFENVSSNAFLAGIRFDLSAIAYINLILAIFHFIPGAFKYKR
jgi:hypothetical protein